MVPRIISGLLVPGSYVEDGRWGNNSTYLGRLLACLAHGKMKHVVAVIFIPRPDNGPPLSPGDQHKSFSQANEIVQQKDMEVGESGTQS